MFIDICCYFKWVGGYFLHTGLEEIYAQGNIMNLDKNK